MSILADRIGEVLNPDRFTFLRPLQLQQCEETIRWEIFQGRLLDETQTRQQRAFCSWYILDKMTPLFSVKFDVDSREVHLVRYVESYVHEGYDEGGGVYRTRERRKLVAERIASFSIEQADLLEELELALHRAITGTRLPLSPIEAPHPAFSFGQLWYRSNLAAVSRQLEFDLRSLSLHQVVSRWAAHPQLAKLLRQMMLEVSLTPYTDFVDRLMQFLDSLDSQLVLDFECWLLRLVSRHLTAYDLVRFHHRGANYPDILLLDAVLQDLMERLQQDRSAFTGELARSRRGALRQAYVIRRSYEGHAVPDIPTSPGEHARVFPSQYPRVPEEQIIQTNKRRKILFQGTPLRECLSDEVRQVLRQSLEDLVNSPEGRELGRALYLDRPLGGGMGAVVIDQTPLFASLAFSRSIAQQRLQLLSLDLGITPVKLPWEEVGIGLEQIGGPVRPGTVSLSDAALSSRDFCFTRTLKSSLRSLVEWFDFGEQADYLLRAKLLARSPSSPGLLVYDETYRAIGSLEPLLGEGYVTRRGVDLPRAGLLMTRLDDQERGSQRIASIKAG